MENPSITLFDPFLSITDPRLDRKKLHNLFEILVITICAVVCNVDNWEHIAEFARSNEDWFKKFLALENGIPSADTLNRVFTLLDPEEFEKSFIAWMQMLYQVSDGEIVAIDGKAVKGTYDRDLRKTALHLVSAFSTQNGVVLGQVATAEKSNEITAIPKLLELLNLKGCIVTIDAAGCQKKITKKIVERGADYVLALKGNQGQFHDDIKLFVNTNYERHIKSESKEVYETIEKDHGRIETRRFWVTENIDWLDEKEKWSKLTSIGLVESIREVNGKTTEERRYYITSLQADTKQFATAVRKHWCIENKLHWVLDVSFNEDANQTKNPRASHNLAIMRRLALNAIRQDSSKGSMKTKMLKAGWSKKFRSALLRKLFKF